MFYRISCFNWRQNYLITSIPNILRFYSVCALIFSNNSSVYVFERSTRRRRCDVSIDAIHSFRTSVPSSGTDSLADTSVIIFAFRSFGNSVATLINALHSSAISRHKYFRREMRSVTLMSVRRADMTKFTNLISPNLVITRYRALSFSEITSFIMLMMLI